MTQVFDETGNVTPVTVVLAGPCVITAIRTKDKDGYNAIQLGYGDVKEKSLTKPYAGQFKKNNVTPKKYLCEFTVSKTDDYKIGQEIKADIFKPGDYIDVSGVSKGKGFAGNVKRHGFGGGPSTHGQSDRQRSPGSIGGQGPQRVLRGMRMAGHLGQEVVTTQKLEVVSVDNEKNLLLIKGAMPGVNQGILVIEESVKRVKSRPEAPNAAAP
jgi:large subunit ribosomal protein L3